jgi:hypothetical protein
MGRGKEYRSFAARCVEIARMTADPQTKAVMLQMAQIWSRLADEQNSLRRRRIELNPDSNAADQAGQDPSS